MIAWFFQWTVNPSGKTAVLSDNGNGYYNLLTQGFLKGHTAIDREVDAGMLAVKDPYDPRQRAGRGMHDASYFQGRYFIYFGATPAVAVFVPVKIFDGKIFGRPVGGVCVCHRGFLGRGTVNARRAPAVLPGHAPAVNPGATIEKMDGH